MVHLKRIFFPRPYPMFDSDEISYVGVLRYAGTRVSIKKNKFPRIAAAQILHWLSPKRAKSMRLLSGGIYELKTKLKNRLNVPKISYMRSFIKNEHRTRTQDEPMYKLSQTILKIE